MSTKQYHPNPGFMLVHIVVETELTNQNERLGVSNNNVYTLIKMISHFSSSQISNFNLIISISR